MKGYIVRTTPFWSNGKPYDVHEIETKTFNLKFCYYFGEVYDTEEEAIQALEVERKGLLEDWAAQGSSNYWAIGPTSGEECSIPIWWKEYDYTGEKVFVDGYQGGWYWKPIPFAETRLTTRSSGEAATDETLGETS